MRRSVTESGFAASSVRFLVYAVERTGEKVCCEIGRAKKLPVLLSKISVMGNVYAKHCDS